ncbi:uncharacterized protein TrAtP1_006829 [Trichoderma atroviride]|uniref:uncharacterized protein n=1 Tax=Hypocrea atroviridis TaxID=63577 RepID=UPI0033212C39|nr:hypothetical protein TrAtP1_006829 [Trichoderma atroviride]
MPNVVVLLDEPWRASATTQRLRDWLEAAGQWLESGKLRRSSSGVSQLTGPEV